MYVDEAAKVLSNGRNALFQYQLSTSLSFLHPHLISFTSLLYITAFISYLPQHDCLIH